MNLKIIILISIIFVTIPLSLQALNHFGLIHDMNAVTDGVILTVYGSIIFALMAFGSNALLKWKKILPVAEMPSLQDKKQRRNLTFYIVSGKRLELGQTAAIMLIIGIISIFMFQGLIQNIPQEQLAQEALSIYGFIKVTVTVFPFFLIGIGAWFSASLINSIRFDKQKSNRKKINEYTKLTEDFEESLKAVKSVSNLQVRLDMLDELKIVFSQLCEKYSWQQIGDKVEKVINVIIPERISNDTYRKGHVELLVLIIKNFPENTLTTIHDKWQLELERMLSERSQDSQEALNVLYLLQEINQFSEEYMKKLVKDASELWTDDKFALLSKKIGFKELRKNNLTGFQKINELIITEMDETAQKNTLKYTRLKVLRELARA